jgi:hypothetical protein
MKKGSYRLNNMAEFEDLKNRFSGKKTLPQYLENKYGKQKDKNVF